MAMNPWKAAALGGSLGLILGVTGLRTLEMLTVDRDLDRQKTELARISGELRAKEAALDTGQAKLTAQAEQLRQTLAEARNLADQTLGSQGSAGDKLKRTIETLRQVRDLLRTTP